MSEWELRANEDRAPGKVEWSKNCIPLNDDGVLALVAMAITHPDVYAVQTPWYRDHTFVFLQNGERILLVTKKGV